MKKAGQCEQGTFRHPSRSLCLSGDSLELWLPFRFASLELCLQRQASVLCFFLLIFPLPFFVIFWSSVCSCCRRGAVFFYPFFLVWSAIRFSPILVFLKPGFLSFVCLEFSTSVVVVVVVASCLDLFQSVFVCSF
jgi:hypothetical protein